MLGEVWLQDGAEKWEWMLAGQVSSEEIRGFSWAVPHSFRDRSSIPPGPQQMSPSAPSFKVSKAKTLCTTSSIFRDRQTEAESNEVLWGRGYSVSWREWGRGRRPPAAVSRQRCTLPTSEGSSLDVSPPTSLENKRHSVDSIMQSIQKYSCSFRKFESPHRCKV